MKTVLLFTFLLISSLGFSQNNNNTVISCDMYNYCEDFKSWAFITSSDGTEGLVQIPKHKLEDAKEHGVSSYILASDFYYEIYLSSCGKIHLVVVDLIGQPEPPIQVVEQLSIDFEITESIYTIKRQ